MTNEQLKELESIINMMTIGHDLQVSFSCQLRR